MLELLVLILFIWLFAGAVRLTFQVTWGLAKCAAIILFVLALPTMAGCLLMASGLVLLLPLALVGSAFGILKSCL